MIHGIKFLKRNWGASLSGKLRPANVAFEENIFFTTNSSGMAVPNNHLDNEMVSISIIGGGLFLN